MSSVVLSHSPSSLLAWVLCHFFSDPSPRNDQCLRVNLRALLGKSVISRNAICSASLFFPNVIVHWDDDDTSFKMLRFTLYGLLNLVETSQCEECWEIFPLELHSSPSNRSVFFFFSKMCFQKNHLMSLSHALTCSVLIPPRVGTESEETYVFAVANWLTLSVNRVVSPHTLPPINRCNSSNFSLVSDHFPSHLKQLSHRLHGLILGRSQDFL